MVTVLSKLFIKNRTAYTDSVVRRAYGVLCGGVGIFLNLLLFAAKLFAGSLTQSIAITADAFNNLSDAGSSIVTLLGFRLAAQKPDPDHPFGHGRIEYISGLIVSFLIILMGFELGKSSVEKILNPVGMDFSLISIAILTASILVKVYMAVYNRSIGKKIDSAALRATGLDSLSDCIATGVVLCSLLINRFFHIDVDAYCGILVAGFILFAGYRAAKETIDPLLGQAPDPEFVKQVEDLVMTDPNVTNIHDLIVHDYGPGRRMISVHAEVPCNADIMELHDAIDNIERHITKELGCHAVIHMDPVANDDETTIELRKQIMEIMCAIDEQLSLHDFRVVPGPTHTNIIFDVVVPFNYRLTDAELVREFTDRVRKINPNYYCVITVDKSYC